MKLSIEKAVLTNALAAAARVVERRNTIPILANVALYAEAGGLRIVSTDLDLELETTIPADIETPGDVTVPAHLLSDIAKKLQTDTVSFSVDGNKQIATVSSGRSKFQLHCLPTGDFPNLTHGGFKNTFQLPAATLKTLLGKTKFAMSSEETRYYLCGIYLHVIEGDGDIKMRAAATDGHRLARYEISAPEGSASMTGVIIPRKTVNELERMCDLVDEVIIDTSENKIRVRAGDVVLTSKLIDGTFPDYERVIPAYGNFPVATFDRGALAASADRVSTVASERGRAVALQFAENNLRLRVNNPDSGDAEDFIEVEYESEPLEVGFNSRYLQDILSNLSGGKGRLAINTPGDPTVFRDEDSEATVYVLMPMRI